MKTQQLLKTKSDCSKQTLLISLCYSLFRKELVNSISVRFCFAKGANKVHENLSIFPGLRQGEDCQYMCWLLSLSP